MKEKEKDNTYFYFILKQGIILHTINCVKDTVIIVNTIVLHWMNILQKC